MINYVKNRIEEILKSKNTVFVMFNPENLKTFNVNETNSFFLKKEKILISLEEDNKKIILKIYFSKLDKNERFLVDLLKVFRKEFKIIDVVLVVKKFNKINI
ncbi:MAG: hypothetical protein NZZ41_04145 [Candidatus Dojkabacteria bacterium]|nr:hypothetical protein [Candidatus Dojkabacteria bacterium]